MIGIPQHLLQGKEPFFACSRLVLKGQMASLKALGVEIFYSVKTNPEKCILEELGRLGTSFSVSNPSEFLSIVSMGAAPDKILYYERGLTPEKVRWLAQSGCRNFVVESAQAFENLAPEIKPGFTVLIRMRASEPKSRYAGSCNPGLEANEALELAMKAKKRGAASGILHHNSSQMEEVSDWKSKFDTLSKLPELDIIDIGGGLPISYDGGNFDAILEVIHDGVKKLKAKRVIAEPGRFIVGPACSLVARVELVDNGNAVLNCSVYNVHIDTIIADLVLPCRVLGKQGSVVEYKLLGSSLCNLDVFDKKAKLPKLSVGDAIVFDKAGAYNFSSDFGSGSGIKTYIVD